MAEAIQQTSDTERDKLSVLLAIILASATLFRFVELPDISWGVQSVLGSPLGFDFGGEMLVVILIVGLVSTGTLSILQEHPLRDTQERPMLFSLITPAIGSLLVSLLLIRATSWILWLVAFTHQEIILTSDLKLLSHLMEREETFLLIKYVSISGILLNYLNE